MTEDHARSADEDDGPRQYFATLDDALRVYRIPVENQQRAREILSRFDYGRIYMPSRSRSYVAFEGLNGPPAIAWLRSGYVEFRTAPGTYDYEALPTNSIGMGGGGGRRSREEIHREPCPHCYTELPATGVCGTCD